MELKMHLKLMWKRLNIRPNYLVDFYFFQILNFFQKPILMRNKPKILLANFSLSMNKLRFGSLGLTICVG